MWFQLKRKKTKRFGIVTEEQYIHPDELYKANKGLTGYQYFYKYLLLKAEFPATKQMEGSSRVRRSPFLPKCSHKTFGTLEKRCFTHVDNFSPVLLFFPYLLAREGPAWVAGAHSPGEDICATPPWCGHRSWAAVGGPTAGGGGSCKHPLVSTVSQGKVFSFTGNLFVQFPSGVLCLPGHARGPASLPHQCFSLCTVMSHVAPENLSTA